MFSSIAWRLRSSAPRAGGTAGAARGRSKPFRNAIDRAVQQIAAGPEQGSPFRTHYRWVRTRRFPYVLYYHILDADHVVLLAVAHARRRSGYWLRRSRS
jgi:plasmid stabilization system protein ParE